MGLVMVWSRTQCGVGHVWSRTQCGVGQCGVGHGME